MTTVQLHSFFYNDKDMISDLVILSDFHLESKYFPLKIFFLITHFWEEILEGNPSLVWGELLKPCIDYQPLSSFYLNACDDINHKLHFLSSSSSCSLQRSKPDSYNCCVCDSGSHFVGGGYGLPPQWKVSDEAVILHFCSWCLPYLDLTICLLSTSQSKPGKQRIYQ